MSSASFLKRLTAAAFLISCGLPWASGTADAAEIHPALAAELETLRASDYVSVILTMEAQADVAGLDAALRTQRASRQARHATVVTALQTQQTAQDDLLALLESERGPGGEVAGFTSHWISNLVVAKVSKTFVQRLAARNDVAFIEPNFRVELIAPEPENETSGEKASDGATRGIGVTPGLRAINADRVWYELGITGAGTLVANCDTGVDGNHPALSDRWRGNVAPAEECWLNLIGGHPSFPYDGGSHGTHVMGTITGLGAATEDTIGVAWNALWIATDPINQGVGGGFDNDIIAAFEWFADPDGNPATVDDVPDVVQNSWGVIHDYWPEYDYCDSRWWAVIDNCEAAGCATIWSAGNEGDDIGDASLRAPADRATTLTNAFSVGAIDATNYSFPYPIADFSSRGPTRCDVPADRLIKPEVVAPGVSVYSSVPGGGYQQWGWNGTSMAGPHVAGVVALMREANPNLDVVTMKEILMATAIDLGDEGEENTFGWGVIDAYEAVLAAMTGFGELAGTITNASNGGTPAGGVTIQVDEADRMTTSAIDGTYALGLAPGTYTVRAYHPSFAEQVFTEIVVEADQTTVVDFSLVDIGSPQISETTDYDSTGDTDGPYTIATTVSDEFSAIGTPRLYYRVNEGRFSAVDMLSLFGGHYEAAIPGQPYTSHVEYYIEASDVAGNIALDPPAVPDSLFDFYVAVEVLSLATDVEAGAGDWTHAPASSGFDDEWHVSGQRNHTAGGAHSWKCGDTGSGDYADFLDAALLSPAFEIGEEMTLRFWHWIDAHASTAFPGYTGDGGIVELSLDGGPWQQITPEGGYDHLYARMTTPPGPFPNETPCFSGSHEWEQVEFDLSGYSGTAQLRFRFGTDAQYEGEGWYIDDVRVNGFLLNPSAVEEGEPSFTVRVLPAEPNPVVREAHLRFALGAAADVELKLFDPAGRLVRTLVHGRRSAGLHEVVWDGRDARAQRAAPGVYFYRLRSGGTTAGGKLIVTH